MTREEMKAAKEFGLKDIKKRMDDILSLYQVDQQVEGLKRLTDLFIDMTAARACTLQRDTSGPFVVIFCLSLTKDIIATMDKMREAVALEHGGKEPIIIKMNAEFKS